MLHRKVSFSCAYNHSFIDIFILAQRQGYAYVLPRKISAEPEGLEGEALARHYTQRPKKLPSPAEQVCSIEGSFL
ncbi:hypothetical protein WMW72_14735 [Paenibacillus filicis]|uniref:Uncharacterized protein n=1 Tax=Paenibacillus filicis TaxID=669464 RepID=A0ABU9DJW1_9BACL